MAAGTVSVPGDVIRINNSIPSGTQSRSAQNDFIGIIDGIQPTTILGGRVTFNPLRPPTDSFQIGDLGGRDMNDSGGGRTWIYELTLPSDALPGTGLSDIRFTGRAFEALQSNLEGSDQIQWQMFINSQAAPVDQTGPAAGSDWSTFDVSLFHSGGAGVTSVQVILTINGFNAGNEWFATRGELEANYSTIPEPTQQGFLLLLALVGAILRMRIRSAR